MCLELKAEIATRNEIIRKLEERLLKLERQPEKRQSGNPKYTSYQ